MPHPLNPYYEKRSHREGQFILPIIIIAFLIGSAAVIFALTRLVSLLITSTHEIDSYIENLMR